MNCSGARPERGASGEWRPYRAQAHRAVGPLLTQHFLFRRLGRTQAQRLTAYRALFRTKLGQGFVEALRAATNGGWALGGERFKQQIASARDRVLHRCRQVLNRRPQRTNGR